MRGGCWMAASSRAEGRSAVRTPRRARTRASENPIPRDTLTNAEAPPRMISSRPASIPLLPPLSLPLSLSLSLSPLLPLPLARSSPVVDDPLRGWFWEGLLDSPTSTVSRSKLVAIAPRGAWPVTLHADSSHPLIGNAFKRRRCDRSAR